MLYVLLKHLLLLYMHVTCFVKIVILTKRHVSCLVKTLIVTLFKEIDNVTISVDACCMFC